MGARTMGWMKVAGRLGLALCVASMSACLKDDSGSSQSSVGAGVATPLTAVWIDQSTPAGGATGDTPLSDVWIDSTTVTPTGAGAILPSIDEITYGFPKPYLPVGNPNLNHPLMTHSSAAAILNPEDQLLTLINNYRLQTLGGLGGIGGGGGLGGGGVGVPIGGIAITAIPPSGKLRKNARAHCKHYARYHDLDFPIGNAQNVETDSIYGGGIQTPQGRLRKSNVTVTGWTEQTLFGVGVSTAQEAFDTLVTGPSIVLTTTAYTYIGIGHWPQGFRDYYWTIILGNGVNPVN